MAVYHLGDLPPAATGKTGWPWTEEGPPLPATLPNGKPWPSISVVTPSFNQAAFIEQTIRSVLLQSYPAVDYIIIDGGSSDESVGIIKKYQKYLSHWVSEKDRGQSHAINKGFKAAKGDVICWLNSDDYFMPGTLRTVGEILSDGTQAMVGHCLKIYQDGRPNFLLRGKYEGRERLLKFWQGYQMHQPSIFWRREVMEKVGHLDESQKYIMDFDYWVRISEHFDFKNVDQILSCANFHQAAKTGDDYQEYHQQLRKQSPRYWGSPLSVKYWSLKASMAMHQSRQSISINVNRLVRTIRRRI